MNHLQVHECKEYDNGVVQKNGKARPEMNEIHRYGLCV